MDSGRWNSRQTSPEGVERSLRQDDSTTKSSEKERERGNCMNGISMVEFYSLYSMHIPGRQVYTVDINQVSSISYIVTLNTHRAAGTFEDGRACYIY